MGNLLDRAWFNALVDDTGGGTDGSFWDKAAVDALMDDIDEALVDTLAITVTGTQNNYALPLIGAVVVRWAGSSAVTFSGFQNPSSGRRFLFLNATAGQIASFTHEDAGTVTAANRLSNPESATVAVGPGCLAIIVYDSTTARWRVRVLAGQLTFPATPAPSTNANTLDDYEEGTWTPTIGGATSESGQVYSVQVGRYVKIGKLVHVQCRIALSTLGTITGNVMIKGLPFTAANAANAYSGAVCGDWAALTTAQIWVGGHIIPNTTTIELRSRASASVASTGLVQADLSNTTTLIFSATYEAQD